MTTTPTTAAQLARYLDHTMLAPHAGRTQFEKLCKEARQWKTAAVCVPSSWVKFCAEHMEGSGVAVCSVVGFPHGNSSLASKLTETREAIHHGASEIDMVINFGNLLDGQEQLVLQEIQAISDACHQGVSGQTALLKVIFENSALHEHGQGRGPDLIRRACELSSAAKADFVKTGTGFWAGKFPSAATIDDVELMRACCGPQVGVKAAGGIRDFDTACQFIRAGASRLGCSSSATILEGQTTNRGY